MDFAGGSGLFQVQEGDVHGVGDCGHPAIVARKCDRLSLLEQIGAGGKMQGIQGPHGNRLRKSIQSAVQDCWSKLQKRNSSNEPKGRLTVGIGEIARVKPGPYLVLHQPAGYEGLGPKPDGWAAVFSQQLGKHYRSIQVDHRSLRSSAISASRSRSGATGSGVGGVPTDGSVGGVKRPLRTASASNASARIGLLVGLGGPISATTRSRSVTRTVSPDAARRMYSLKRLLSIFIPTDLIRNKVATGSYFFKLRSGDSLIYPLWKIIGTQKLAVENVTVLFSSLPILPQRPSPQDYDQERSGSGSR